MEVKYKGNMKGIMGPSNPYPFPTLEIYSPIRDVEW